MRSAESVASAAHHSISIPADANQAEHAQGRRGFSIATSMTSDSRRSANALLRQRYGWRGYEPASLPLADSIHHFPLTATQDGEVIGTLTVGIDGPSGLNCDRAFSDEVRALRANGARLCEFTKLAIDPSFGSKHVLAALFHVAYLAADRLADVNTLLMEVNPRHVRYYQRMLGAKVIGNARENMSVNAPAVLLAMGFADVRGRIDAIAGSPTRVGGDRSLYSLAFSRDEEDAIVSRLLSRSPQTDDVVPFGFRLPSAQTAAPVEH